MRTKNKHLPKLWVIIPAAGIGSRIKTVTKPKQYHSISEKPIIEHTLNLFLQSSFEKIIVTIQKSDPYWDNLSISSNPQIHTTIGGQTRMESVWNGLNALHDFNVISTDWVLTHDAVRPCLTSKMLTQFINALKNEAVGGTMAIPAQDTLKYVIDNEIDHTLSRKNIWHAQTPQMFRFSCLYEALKKTKQQNINVSDEACAIEKLGYRPKIIPGDISNIKITYDRDIALATCLLRSR